MASVPPTIPPAIVYPESDGLPMSENTKQFDWIQLLAANLKILFATRDDVFVSGNQFWYPVKGRPDINQSRTCTLSLGVRRETAVPTSSGRKTTFQ